MWKKPIVPGARNVLSSKDRKKLEKLLKSAFPLVSDDIAQSLLKTSELSVVKIKGSKSVIYADSKGVPLFFEPESADAAELCPTIHALARTAEQQQQMAPCFLVPPEVSTFVLGGADLMGPGIYIPSDCVSAYPPEGLVRGGLFCVRVAGNPVPFAVGKCLLGRKEFGPSLAAPVEPAAEPKKKFVGRALAVLHYYNDFLYQFGGGASEQAPAGFGNKIIKPLSEGAENFQLYPQLRPAGENFAVTTDALEEGEEDLGEKCENKSSTQVTEEEEEAPTDGTGAKAADCGEDPPDVAPAAAPDESPPPELMETFLEYCFLEVMHTEFTDASKLPVSYSTVYERMISVAPSVQFSPRFRKFLMECEKIAPKFANDVADGKIILPLDVKQTSHKKIARFFQHWSRKTKGITVKEIRGTGVIFSVDRKNVKYTSWIALTEADKKAAAKILAAAAAETAASVGDLPKTSLTDAPARSSSEKANFKFQMIELYVPQSCAAPIFEQTGVAPEVQGKYYTHAQVVQAVNAYVKQQQLQLPDNKGQVALDPLLMTCCYGAKQPPQDDKPLSYATLHAAFQGRMRAAHAIVRGNGTDLNDVHVNSGKLTPVEISTETRRGNKVQTIITNIHQFQLQPKEFAEHLQKQFAASASTFEIQSIAGKTKPLGVAVQGTWVTEVVELLCKQHGIPKKYIETK